MKVLLDTNVVLDVLLARGPWLASAGAIWNASQSGKLTACITSSSVTDIYYVLRKAAGAAVAKQAVRDCLDVLMILPVIPADLETAWNSGIGDFEDALQVACSVREGLDSIVTRNIADFAGAPIPIWTPDELVVRLTSSP